jgi:NADH-quinone oxidoreductase subunit N
MNLNWTQFFWSSLPLTIVVASGLAVMMVGLLLPRSRLVLLALSLLGIAASFAASIYLWSWRLFSSVSMITVDPFAFFLYMVLLFIGFLTLLNHYEYLEKQQTHYPEVYSLTLFALSGMMLMVSTTHLLVFFLALEVMSLAVYVLVGIKRRDPRSNEGAMKYFILGALTAGVLLYGIALLYGITGQFDLKLIAIHPVRAEDLNIFRIGILLVLIAFAFKVAAVPFHFWTPDVYEGAPLSVTGLMATAVKTAAFGAFLRSLMPLIGINSIPIQEFLQFLSLATMIVGNLVALYQTNVKRMLAYSSIAHAGYLLVGVTAAYVDGHLNQDALGAPIFYLLAYGILTVGAFAVASAVATDKSDCAEQSDYAGLGTRSPKLAAAMAVFMVGLTGIPPTIGFAGKFFIFREALARGLYSLVIVGVLMSAISAYYYLRVVVAMYFARAEEEEIRRLPVPVTKFALAFVVLFCAVMTLYIGLVPSRYLKMASVSGFIPLRTIARGPVPPF